MDNNIYYSGIFGKSGTINFYENSFPIFLKLNTQLQWQRFFYIDPKNGFTWEFMHFAHICPIGLYNS